MKRNLTLDVAKGIGIILVILGHALQYGAGLDTKGAMDLGLEKFISISPLQRKVLTH